MPEEGRNRGERRKLVPALAAARVRPPMPHRTQRRGRAQPYSASCRHTYATPSAVHTAQRPRHTRAHKTRGTAAAFAAFTDASPARSVLRTHARRATTDVNHQLVHVATAYVPARQETLWLRGNKQICMGTNQWGNNKNPEQNKPQYEQ